MIKSKADEEKKIKKTLFTFHIIHICKTLCLFSPADRQEKK